MRWDSDPRPYEYESTAQPLSYRPICDVNAHTLNNIDNHVTLVNLTDFTLIFRLSM